MKILITGPQQGGKTIIANALAGLQSSSQYEATDGVRILEADFSIVSQKGRDIHPEIWDCSGGKGSNFSKLPIIHVIFLDLKYENCWAAMIDQADAVIIVCQSGNERQINQIPSYMNWFVRTRSSMLNERDCMIVTLDFDTPRSQNNFNLPEIEQIQRKTVHFRDERMIREIIKEFIDDAAKKKEF